MKVRHDLPISENSLVYPPSEDSYLMIEAVSVSAGEKVLEIGSGSGIVSIHCALEGAAVTAVDINPEAVSLTERNAGACGLSEGVKAVQGDLFSPVGAEKFDVIIFNPPYLISGSGSEVRGEPIEAAWNGGEKGREVIERFLKEAGEHLSQKGRIYLLLEKQNRAPELKKMFPGYEWREVAIADFFFEHLAVSLLNKRERMA